MKLVLIAFLGILNFNVNAAVFTGTFWEKNLNCSVGTFECLPRTVEKATNFEFEYPSVDIPTEIEITGKEYLVNIFMVLHTGPVDYYTIQFTVKDLEENIIAMCSRYESVDTVEEIPVGSCGGVNPKKENILAGFTISLSKN